MPRPSTANLPVTTLGFHSRQENTKTALNDDMVSEWKKLFYPNYKASGYYYKVRAALLTKISSVKQIALERPSTAIRSEQITETRPMSARTSVSKRLFEMRMQSKHLGPRYKFTKKKFISALSYVSKTSPSLKLYSSKNRILTVKDLKKMVEIKEEKPKKSLSRPRTAVPTNKANSQADTDRGMKFAQFLIENTLTFRIPRAGSKDTIMRTAEPMLMPAFKISLPIKPMTAKYHNKNDTKHIAEARKTERNNTINYATIGSIPIKQNQTQLYEKPQKRIGLHRDVKVKNGIALTIQTPGTIEENKANEKMMSNAETNLFLANFDNVESVEAKRGSEQLRQNFMKEEGNC
jgi:hypothetical protein